MTSKIKQIISKGRSAIAGGIVITIPFFTYYEYNPLHNASLVLAIINVIIGILISSNLIRLRIIDITINDILTATIIIISSIGLLKYNPSNELIMHLLLYIQIYVLFRFSFYVANIASMILLTAIIQSIIAYIQYAGVENAPHAFFQVKGTFVNPAILGITISLGCVIAFYRIIHNIKTLYSLICIIIFIPALYLTHSRAAVLSGVISVIYMTIRQIRLKQYFKVCIVFSIFILLLYLLYYIRVESANGRLLIWQVSYMMICDHPFIGVGCGEFSRIYPLYQASYFENNPMSEYSHLAGDIHHPFNEYINILVSIGILGFILTMLLVLNSLRYLKYEYFYILLSILIFAVFSYPLYDIYFCIIIAAILGIASTDSMKLRTLIIRKYFTGVYISLLLVLFGWQIIFHPLTRWRN